MSKTPLLAIRYELMLKVGSTSVLAQSSTGDKISSKIILSAKG